MPSGEASWRVGVDENGLGARLGPLVVTAVLARVSGDGERVLARRPRGRLGDDLDDSKRLVSHSNVALGEAWARALTGDRHETPQALFEHLSLDSAASLREHCPSHLEAQCWDVLGESFVAPSEVFTRVAGHVEKLRARGVEIAAVRVTSVCTQRLNAGRVLGKNRFVTDLHAMERLLLALRAEAGADLFAVCGKVGGMSDYERFFGPLSGYLRCVLESSRRRSAYRFPGLGEVHFVQDADARDPLVMLASLVGKYVRELLMARVARFYERGAGDPEAPSVSGYHDARTNRWVLATSALRRSLSVVHECFERARDEAS